MQSFLKYFSFYYDFSCHSKRFIQILKLSEVEVRLIRVEKHKNYMQCTLVVNRKLVLLLNMIHFYK
jgi:hypothetical protein